MEEVFPSNSLLIHRKKIFSSISSNYRCLHSITCIMGDQIFVNNNINYNSIAIKHSYQQKPLKGSSKRQLNMLERYFTFQFTSFLLEVVCPT